MEREVLRVDLDDGCYIHASTTRSMLEDEERWHGDSRQRDMVRSGAKRMPTFYSSTLHTQEPGMLLSPGSINFVLRFGLEVVKSLLFLTMPLKPL